MKFDLILTYKTHTIGGHTQFQMETLMKMRLVIHLIHANQMEREEEANKNRMVKVRSSKRG